MSPEFVHVIQLSLMLLDYHRFVSSNNFPFKFTDRDKWKSQFQECDESVNPFQSPISINTTAAIRDKDLPTLFVHAGSPIHDYVLQVQNQLPEGKTFEVVTLRLYSDKQHEATYVSGIGDTSYRYFHSAAFLVSSSNPSDDRFSLHRIDGKEFQMEIVLEFKGNCGDVKCNAMTQIHVLVQVAESENPLLNPIVDALNTLRDRQLSMTSISGKISDQYAKLDEIEKALEPMMTEDVEDEKASLKDLAKAVSAIKANQEEIDERKTNIKAWEKELSLLESQIGIFKKGVVELKKAIQDMRDKVKELKARRKKCKKQECNDAYDQTIRKFDNEEKEYQKQVDKKEQGVVIKESVMKNTQNKLQKVTQLVAKLETWNTKQLELHNQPSVQHAEKYLTEKVKTHRFIALKQKQQAREKAKLNSIIQQTQPIATLDVFQEVITVTRARDFVSVSETRMDRAWGLLAPKLAFLHELNILAMKSRLPLLLSVPPCELNKFTLVMEKPITISRRQLEAFIIRASKEVVLLGDTVPLLHPLGDRKVYYNKKNLQFMLDDHVHMRSKLRKRMKDALKSNGSVVSTAKSHPLKTGKDPLISRRLR